MPNKSRLPGSDAGAPGRVKGLFNSAVDRSGRLHPRPGKDREYPGDRAPDSSPAVIFNLRRPRGVISVRQTSPLVPQVRRSYRYMSDPEKAKPARR